MSLRQATLNPWLRSVAVLAVLVFVAAQATCFVHCQFGGGRGAGEGEPPSCHRSAKAKEKSSCPNASDPMPVAACSTFKTMLAGGDSPPLNAPEAHTLYLLAPAALSLAAIATELEAIVSRQGRSSDRVFTPAVSLGPAFRSLAPPLVG